MASRDLPPGFSIPFTSDNRAPRLVIPGGLELAVVHIDDAYDLAWKKFEEMFKISEEQWLAMKKAAELFPQLLAFADAMYRAPDTDVLYTWRDQYISWAAYAGVDDVRRNLKGDP